jgi:hypothetical protein
MNSITSTTRWARLHQGGVTAAKDMKALRCQRCSRRLRNHLMNSAVAFTSDGAITAVVCIACLTVEEFMDSEMFAATHEVVFARGQILAQPKVRRAES